MWPDGGARRARQDTVIHETQTMVEQRHPNLLPLLCCFVHGKQLWMVMPYMAGGSLLSIMQSNFPEARARPHPRRRSRRRSYTASLLWHRGRVAVVHGRRVQGPKPILYFAKSLRACSRARRQAAAGPGGELVAIAVMHGGPVLGPNPTQDF